MSTLLNTVWLLHYSIFNPHLFEIHYFLFVHLFCCLFCIDHCNKSNAMKQVAILLIWNQYKVWARVVDCCVPILPPLCQYAYLSSQFNVHAVRCTKLSFAIVCICVIGLPTTVCAAFLHIVVSELGLLCHMRSHMHMLYLIYLPCILLYILHSPSKHTSSIWLLHNYYRYNVKPKYPLISYVDVCLMAVLYTDAGDECCIITIEWWYWVEMAWLQPCCGRRDYVDWCRTWLRDDQRRISFWSFSGYSGKSLE